MTLSLGSCRHRAGLGACLLAACLASCAPARDSRAPAVDAPSGEPAPGNAVEGSAAAAPVPAATSPLEPESALQSSPGASSANAAGEIELDSGDNLDADIAELSKATKVAPEKKA